ncbi:MAG: phosphatidate cytidylyltransferase [Sulfurospirillaceae bacterium]|nr:phosphatidate cytidylyltransferase [Sulfurospirillaceae bacterium]MDD3462491.1 phosphatidate cytidylyltransferase [Sulfurospirillaceae bacterium]
MGIKELFESHKERITTGFAMLLAATFVAVIDSLFVTWAILGVVYMFAFYEAMNLFEAKDNKLFVYAVAVWITAYFYPNPDDLIFIVLILSLSIMSHSKEVDFKKIAPFLYPSISMLFIYTLYQDFGMEVLVWFVLIVATTDTMAYFIGKSVGKTPFSATSPNKTWEGVLGGIICASILGTFVGIIFISFFKALIISVLVSAVSVWSDLFESYLKRMAGVKDSGDIFPGHGGMLDRLDGYLFSAVLMVILLRGLS